MSDDTHNYLLELNKRFAETYGRFDVLPKFKLPVFEPIVTIRPLTPVVGITQIGNAFQAMQDRMAEIFKPFTGLQEALERLPPQIRTAVSQLASHGWFVSGEMPQRQMIEWGEMLQAGHVEKVDAILCSFFESRIASIREKFEASLTDRFTIIDAAIQAHENGQYVLSVPVFLAQADGVCHARIQASPFRKQGRGKTDLATGKWVDKSPSKWLDAFISPLKEAAPIAQTENERGKGFTGLNRHAVLHGEDVSYGSKLNSFKALSLLVYIDHFVRPHECRE